MNVNCAVYTMHTTAYPLFIILLQRDYTEAIDS